MKNANFTLQSVAFILFSFISLSLSANEPELTLSIRFDDKIYHVGDVVSASVAVNNFGSVEVKNIILEIILPHQLVSADKQEVIIPSLASGNSQSFTFSCRAIEGGRGWIYYKATAGGFNVQEFSAVSIAGPGWYGGDNHSHSTHSDGRGTILQNMEVAYSKGMSWHYAADHNNTRARAEMEKVSKESRGDFIAIAGIEVDNAIGHGLAYRLPGVLENDTYLTKTNHEGFFDAIPEGASVPVEVPYIDTNLEGSDVFFGELFGGKTLHYLAVPGLGRAADYDDIDITGKIALVLRGEITYVEKINTAIAAGAAGVIIYNHSPGPLGMTLSKDAIGIGIMQTDGQTLAAAGSGVIHFREEKLPSKEKITWQMVVDAVNASGAIFVPAHPADVTYPFIDMYEIRNFAGIEVWNNTDPTRPLNVDAFQMWDNINARGDGKYFGIANTDAHDAANIANVYDMAYMDELTEANVIENIKNGTFFGANGPQIRFDINGVSMGKTCYIQGDKQNVRANITAFDDLYPLTVINLYKLNVTGEATDTRKLLKSWDLTGKNLRQWSVQLEIEVADGEFYRVEVSGEKSTASAGATKGFAYSNPVWIEKNDAPANQAYFTNISLNNSKAKLMQTKAGSYYVICDNTNKLKSKQLKVSAPANVSVTKKYDAANGVFDVTITSPDGSNKRTMKIFTVSTTRRNVNKDK